MKKTITYLVWYGGPVETLKTNNGTKVEILRIFLISKNQSKVFITSIIGFST